jgi:hypothetical protein
MTNVTMKAVDTLHISAVGPHSIQPGEQFDVATHVADDLEARGLATRVKAAPPPKNKMESEPANKAAPKAK